MSLVRAKEYLKKYGLENKIMEFDVSSATVKEAAKAINCKEGEIVKTLSFIVNDIPILIAVAGDSKIDNSKFKAEFQIKAKMIPFDNVEELIGHAVGGVCPFGINEKEIFNSYEIGLFIKLKLVKSLDKDKNIIKSDLLKIS